MKKIIKYRVCAMLILIVLMFSFVPVQAKITDPPSNVEGDGSEENPYVINLSSATRIILQPDTVPFNFIVKGNGELGGIFVIDYDAQNNLVSFTLTETVDENTDTSKLYNSSDENVPRYVINQKLKYLEYPRGVDSYRLCKKTTILTNANANITTGTSSYTKDDVYLFLDDPQINFGKYDLSSTEKVLGNLELSNIVKIFELSNYEFKEIDYGSWFYTDDTTLQFQKLNEERKSYK